MAGLKQGLFGVRMCAEQSGDGHQLIARVPESRGNSGLVYRVYTLPQAHALGSLHILQPQTEQTLQKAKQASMLLQHQHSGARGRRIMGLKPARVA